MQLILFDIDGTLVDSGGAGTRSLNLAFRELFFLEDAFHSISMAGKTDTQIMKEGLLKHDISMDGGLDAVIRAYLKYLQREINNNRRHIKPGIYELLEILQPLKERSEQRSKDVLLGLLTGNLERGARIKSNPSSSMNISRQAPSGAMMRTETNSSQLL